LKRDRSFRNPRFPRSPSLVITYWASIRAPEALRARFDSRNSVPHSRESAPKAKSQI
jgi:hypothetical protein